MTAKLLIGAGNEFRGDDGAGPLVARLLRQCAPAGVTVMQQSGEGSALLEAWRGYDTVILVDAAVSGAAPGTIHRFETAHEHLPAYLASSLSGHAFGVAGAVELARQLERLPLQLIVYGIEARDFTPGAAISPAVAAAAQRLAQQLCHCFA